jgi:hypothetical protein
MANRVPPQLPPQHGQPRPPAALRRCLPRLLHRATPAVGLTIWTTIFHSENLFNQNEDTAHDTNPFLATGLIVIIPWSAA